MTGGAVRIDVLTLFPEMFEAVLGSSILKIAQQKGLLEVVLTNIRDYTGDRHRSVDDRPFGGGPGMVLKVEPIVRAVRDVRAKSPEGGRLLLMTPQGKKFDQARAQELAREKHLLFIAGHYEGYDERIRTILRPDEVSIGDYVLTGGELPAMVVLDAVVRLLPGVLGCSESTVSESFGAGLLEYPQYTRPADFEGHRAPDVLLSGDHAAVDEWRNEEALKRTASRRPDLLRQAGKESEEKEGTP